MCDRDNLEDGNMCITVTFISRCLSWLRKVSDMTHTLGTACEEHISIMLCKIVESAEIPLQNHELIQNTHMTTRLHACNIFFAFTFSDENISEYLNDVGSKM